MKKDGIPRTTPLRPKPQVPSLPSILCSHNQTSISEYSKALRGLSVLPHVARICTGTAISPNPSLRQRSSRYAIHARRNLPDKVFRYLRTVIVTAVIHQCLTFELAQESITFWHWTGITSYTSSFELAGSCVFDKQSPPRHSLRPILL